MPPGTSISQRKTPRKTKIRRREVRRRENLGRHWAERKSWAALGHLLESPEDVTIMSDATMGKRGEEKTKKWVFPVFFGGLILMVKVTKKHLHSNGSNSVHRITFSHSLRAICVELCWANYNLKEHCTAGSSRSFTALRKDAGLCCGSRLRKGEVFAYVGLPQNLKDLKDTLQSFLREGRVVGLCWAN